MGTFLLVREVALKYLLWQARDSASRLSLFLWKLGMEVKRCPARLAKLRGVRSGRSTPELMVRNGLGCGKALISMGSLNSCSRGKKIINSTVLFFNLYHLPSVWRIRYPDPYDTEAKPSLLLQTIYGKAPTASQVKAPFFVFHSFTSNALFWKQSRYS